MPSYEADRAKFEGYDAQVVGISVDSVRSHEAWARSLGGLSFPILLSDFYPHGAVAERYGVLGEDGMNQRAIFIIDKQGIIRYIKIHERREQPSNEELFGVLSQL